MKKSNHTTELIVELNDYRKRKVAQCSCGRLHPIQKENGYVHIHLVWVSQLEVFVEKSTSSVNDVNDLSYTGPKYWEGTGNF